MKVELARTFPLPGAPDAAWRLLQDVEAVASCMPGAKITQRIDDTHYKGTVTVRVGPATLSFRGGIEVKELDGMTRTLRLVGSGSDTAGSAGSMDLTARVVDADGGGSMLNGQSIVSLSGKAAAFGGRMVNAVADQILAQFAANFAARLPAATAEPLSAQAPVTRSATASEPPPASAAPTVSEPQANANMQRSESSAPDATPAPAVKNELNGLALLWAIVRDWLRGIFVGRRA